MSLLSDLSVIRVHLKRINKKKEWIEIGLKKNRRVMLADLSKTGLQ